MALDKDVMVTYITGELITAGFDLDESPMTVSFLNALCDAIVSHIKNNAVVAVTSVSGVTTGIGISGPGTGTIS